MLRTKCGPVCRGFRGFPDGPLMPPGQLGMLTQSQSSDCEGHSFSPSPSPSPFLLLLLRLRLRRVTASIPSQTMSSKTNKNSLQYQLSLVAPQDFPPELRALSTLDSTLRCPVSSFSPSCKHLALHRAHLSSPP
jgi:hypothetical protein